MSAKDDLKLRIEADILSDAYIDAKAAREAAKGTDGFEAAHEAYLKAKKAMSDHRTYWRRIREAVAAGVDAEGNVIVAPVEGTIEFVDVED